MKHSHTLTLNDLFNKLWRSDFRDITVIMNVPYEDMHPLMFLHIKEGTIAQLVNFYLKCNPTINKPPKNKSFSFKYLNLTVDMNDPWKMIHTIGGGYKGEVRHGRVEMVYSREEELSFRFEIIIYSEELERDVRYQGTEHISISSLKRAKEFRQYIKKLEEKQRSTPV
jgi:hypothetical protein